MATYAAAVQAMDKEWAALKQKDRALAEKDAALLRGEAHLKEAVATAKLREDHLQYEMSKTMRPLPKPFTPTSTPSLEAVADDDLAELAEQEASTMGSRRTKNASARTEKQVSHQRYAAARGKDQRAVDAQRIARHRNRLQSRGKRFDYGALEDEVPASSAEPAKVEETGAEGKEEPPEPDLTNARLHTHDDMPRDRMLAKRIAEAHKREAAKRAARRCRVSFQCKRRRIGSRSDESEEEPAPTKPVESARSEKDAQQRSGIGSKVKSWFGGLFRRRRTSTESTACTATPCESAMVPIALEAGDVIAASDACRRPLPLHTGALRVRKAIIKQAGVDRCVLSKASRSPAVARSRPASRPHRAKATKRCQGDGIVKVELDMGASVMAGLIQDLISAPAFAGRRVAAEQHVDLDLLDGLEGLADLQKPCHGAKNSSALTSKQLSSRRWLAARGEDIRARDYNRKARETRRGEARDRKFAVASFVDVA